MDIKHISLILLLLMLVSSGRSYVPPCSELIDIPSTIDDLVPVSMKEGETEIHVFRKYFITKRGDSTNKYPFSETSWTIDVDQDTLFRMRVLSPNTDFKISLVTSSGGVLADTASVNGYGASISSLISKNDLDGDSKAFIKFRFYDFLKSPEEIVQHEDVHTCHLPHIVLEMSIMTANEFKARKVNFDSSDEEVTFPEIETSDLGYKDGSEQSLKMSNSDNIYSLTKTDSESQGKFQILKEYHITISSEDEKSKNKDAANLLYYLQLQVVSDFMTSGSMHVVVAHEKDENDPLVSKDSLFEYDSLNCVEEKVCVVSQSTYKNEEILNIALTEGNYGIYFIDYQNERMRNFIAENVPKIPFSSIVYLYPVESQDNSIY